MLKKDIKIETMFEDDNLFEFIWEDYRDGVMITGYNGTKPFIRLPEYIDDKPVITIGESKISKEYSRSTILLPKTFEFFDISRFNNNGKNNNWYGNVYIADDNEKFTIDDNILFSKDKKKLIFAFNRELESFVVPDGVDSIGERAFSEKTKLVIPGNVKTLDGHPAGTFYFDNNENFIVEGDVVYSSDRKNVVGYYEEVYRGKGYNAQRNTDINSLQIEEPAEVILPYSFCKLKRLKTLILPDTIKRIERKAFAESPLKEIKIPASIEYIDDEAFGYSELKKISVNKKNKKYLTDKICLYRVNEDNTKTLMKCFDHKISEYEIIDGTVEVNDRAFEGCKSLKKFIFPESLKSFNFVPDRLWNSNNIEVISSDNSMFVKEGILYEKIADGYKVVMIAAIKEADIIEGTTEIGDKACGVTHTLEKVSLPSSLKKIGYNSFYCTKLTEVKLNDGLEYIGSQAFSNNDIKSVHIPASMKYIANDAFKDCPLEEYIGKSSEYVAKDGILYSADMKKIIDFPRNKELTDFEVPNEVEDIGCAFLNTKKFDKIVLSNNIRKLGKNSLNFSSDVTVLPDSLEYIDDECIKKTAYGEQNVVNLRVKSDSIAIEYVKSLYDLFDYNGLIPTLEIEGFDEKYCEDSPIRYLPFEGNLHAVFVKDGVKDIVLPLENSGLSVSYSPNFLKGNTELENVQLADGFKSIPYGIFRKSNIVEVTIPDTVDTIEANAFNTCNQIEDIKLPKSVTIIQDHAFSGCRELKSITISANTEKIGKGAFSGSAQLQEIIIPGTVKHIEPYIFANCSNLISIILNDGVETIGEGAFFGCKRLERLSLPKSINYISDKLFSDGENYKDLYLNSNTEYAVESGSYAETFLQSYDCKYELKLVPFNEPIREKIHTIFDAFSCEIIDNNEVMVTLSNSNNSELDVVIPEIIENRLVTKLRFGNQYTNNKLQSLTIPKTVIAFDDMPSFFDAHTLEIIIDNENPAFCVVDNVIYTKDMSKLIRNFNCECEEFIVPDSVKHIGEKAFEYQKNLKKIILPNGITSISSSAFENCRNLEEIIGAENAEDVAANAYDGTPYLNEMDELILGNTLVCYRRNDAARYEVPKGVTEIWKNAFSRKQGDDLLEEIVLPDTLKKIGYSAFWSRNKITTINIPEGVAEICAEAFAGCEKLTVINIPASVKEMPADAFYSNFSSPSSLERINVAEGNQFFKSIDGVLYSGDGTRLIKVPNGYREELIVAEGTEIIGKKAAYKNWHIKKIVLPNSLKCIEESAFSSCSNLEEVEFSNCKDVTVCQYAFNDCKMLKNINLECVSDIGCGAFKACENLNNINLTCKNISSEAFYGCNALSSINLIGTEKIDNSAFARSNLSEVVIPGTVTEIEKSAFEANNLNNVIIPKTVESVGDNAFGSANHVVIHDNLKGNIGKLCVNGLLGSYTYSGTVTSYKITVLSSVDDSEKFTATIENDNTIEYTKLLNEAWGENNTFNFRIIDNYFPKMKNADMKIRTAVRRISEPFMLSDDAKETYLAYISRNAKNIMKSLIDNNDFETFTLLANLGIIKKTNIDDIINYSVEKQKVEFSAFLMDYKENVLKIKEKNDDPIKAMEKEMKKDPYMVKDMKLLWDYRKKDDGTIYISKFIGDNNTTEYFIPPRIGKNTVTEIKIPSNRIGDIIHVPESVTNIHVGAVLSSAIQFDGENNTNIVLEDGYVFSRDKKKIYAVTEEINGEQWIVPDGTEELEPWIIRSSSNVKSIVIPKSFKEIGCLYNITAEVIIDEDNPLFKSTNGLLLSKDGKILFACTGDADCLDIPEGVEKVDPSLSMRRFTSVNIPSTLKEMVSLHRQLEIRVSPDNPHFKTQNNMLLTKDGTQLLHWNKDTKKVYRIPDGVKEALAINLDSNETMICPKSIEKMHFAHCAQGQCFVCPDNDYVRGELNCNVLIEYREAFFNNKINEKFLKNDFSGKKICILSCWPFDFSKPITAENRWSDDYNRLSWLLSYIESKGGEISNKVYKDTEYVIYELFALTSIENRPSLYYTKEYRQYEKALERYDRGGNITIVRCDTDEAKEIIDTLNPLKQQ